MAETLTSEDLEKLYNTTPEMEGDFIETRRCQFGLSLKSLRHLEEVICNGLQNQPLYLSDFVSIRRWEVDPHEVLIGMRNVSIGMWRDLERAGHKEVANSILKTADIQYRIEPLILVFNS